MLILGWFNVIICPVAVIFNLFLVVLVFLRWKLRQIKYALIVNLCITDVAVALGVMLPFGLNLANIWRISSHIDQILGYILISISLISIVLVTLDYYILVFHPYWYPRLVTRSTIIGCIIFTWIAPSPLAFPLYYNIMSVWPFLIAIGSIDALLLSFVLFSHIRTIITLRKIRRQIRDARSRFSVPGGQHVPNHTDAASKGMCHTTMAAIFLLCCYLPITGLSFSRWETGSETVLLLTCVAVTFVLLPSLINPLLICYVTADFRKEALKCFKRHQDNN